MDRNNLTPRFTTSPLSTPQILGLPPSLFSLYRTFQLRYARPTFVPLTTFEEVEALYKATVWRALGELSERGLHTILTATFPGQSTSTLT